jgi:hypothetical protein
MIDLLIALRPFAASINCTAILICCLIAKKHGISLPF